MIDVSIKKIQKCIGLLIFVMIMVLLLGCLIVMFSHLTAIMFESLGVSLWQYFIACISALVIMIGIYFTNKRYD